MLRTRAAFNFLTLLILDSGIAAVADAILLLIIRYVLIHPTLSPVESQLQLSNSILFMYRIPSNRGALSYRGRTGFDTIAQAVIILSQLPMEGTSALVHLFYFTTDAEPLLTRALKGI